MRRSFTKITRYNRSQKFFQRQRSIRINQSRNVSSIDTTVKLDFRDTGLHSDVVNAIHNAGFHEPLKAQQDSIPRMILTDANVPHRVVASETGSGKTLTYLSSISHDFCSFSSDRDHEHPHAAALVLCPNQTLCEQVHRTAERLIDDKNNKKPLLVSEILSGNTAPKIDTDSTYRTNLYISTPGSLVNHMENFMDRGRQRHFVRNLKHLVLDEADSLLTRGYEASLRKVFVFLAYGDVFRKGVNNSDRKDLAKFIRRMMWRHEKSEYSGNNKSPRIFFVGATMPSRGKKSAGAIVRRVFSETADWIDESPMLHRGLENLTFEWNELPAHPKERRKFETSDDAASYRSAIRDWELKFHSSVADEVLMRDEEEEEEEKKKRRTPKVTVVFCRTVRRANEVAEEIRRRVEAKEEEKKAVVVTAIHKGVDASERASYLEWLSGSSSSSSSSCIDPDGTIQRAVLVCTDTAARGLDLKHVDRVLHADFASNAIDFVHRSGRTGRAGESGLVTCFYTQDDYELVHAIRDSIENKKTLEPAFSRRRSFKKNIKRYNHGQ